MNPQPPTPDLLRGHLDLILLSILEGQPLYGFAIIQEAKSRTGGYFEFREGSLYPALHRLEHAGLLSADYGEAGRNGKPRKYYALTPAGEAALAAKRKEFGAFTQAVGRLGGV
jgi:PadR family transcriptional regulator, regulatory protein PadR